MKKIVCSFLAMILVCFSISFPAAAEGTVTFAVSSASGNSGGTVSVSVSTVGNTGLSGFDIIVNYDTNRLIWDSEDDVEEGGFGGNFEANPANGQISCARSRNLTSDVTLFTIRFKIKDDAPCGTASVSLTGIEILAYDEDTPVNVPFDVSSGAVTVAGVHSLEHHEAVSACETSGNIEYWTCTGCGKYFSNADGTVEISESDTILPATGHDWNEGEITTNPTCTTPGVLTYTCRNDASHKKTEAVAVEEAAHSWDDGVVTKEPTCSTEGVMTFTCQNNPEHTKTQSIDKNPENHVLEHHAAVVATCEQGGNQEYWVCTECGLYFADAEGTTQLLKPSVITDPIGHVWDDGVVTKAPTCVDKGVMTFTCKNDSTHTKTEEIDVDKTAHHIEKVDAKAPTCEETGNKEHWKCTYCGTLFADEAGTTKITENDIVIAATGHDWDAGEVTKAPTCVATGVRTLTCKNDSGHTKTEDIAIDLNAHHIEKVDAKAPTCEETGNKEHWKCTYCGKLFADEAGTTEITEDDIVVDAIGHVWDEGVVTKAPTCVATGVRTLTCKNDSGHTKTEDIAIDLNVHHIEQVKSVVSTCERAGNIAHWKCTDCGTLFEDEAGTKKITADSVVIAATGHVWDEGVVTKAPTCVATGVRTLTCKNDSSHTKTIDIAIDPKAHHTEKVESVAPTCEGTGILEHWKCKDCGTLFEDEAGTKEITEDNIVVAATGHIWDEGVVTKAPTCAATGVRTFTCKNDSTHIKTEGIDIDANAHTIKAVEEVAPTCEAEGHKAHYECSSCGKLFFDEAGTNEITKDSIVIAATGHDWDEGVITTVATCSTKGARTFTCKNDSSHTKIEEVGLDPNNHSWGAWEVTTPATCTEKGTETRTCSECHETETRETELDPSNHTWDEGTITKYATPSEDGVITYTCKDCKTTKTETFEFIYKAPTMSGENAVSENAKTSLSSAVKGRSGFSGANIFYCDIKMTVSNDNGKTYQNVTSETMPANGITVIIPYPTGTSPSTHDYVVAHQKVDGSVEILASTERDNGLAVRVKSLSPFAVGYVASTAANETSTEQPTTASTEQQTTAVGNNTGTRTNTGTNVGNGSTTGSGTNAGSGTGTGSGGSSSQSTTAPRTGDENQTILWIILAAISLALILSGLFVGRKAFRK